MKATIHSVEEKELETIGVPWGVMVLVCDTKEFSISVTTLDPGKRLTPYYYKTGGELVYILEGQGDSPHGPLRQGTLEKVVAKETFWLKNNSDAPLRALIICIPPYSAEDCVWLDSEEVMHED
jgi:mannose-6-phosphate isomerase-like protein (cupin superfamily)